MLALALLAAMAPAAYGEVTVRDAWVRGTVPGQDTTGAYMKLTSTTEAAVTRVSSPSVRAVEIHSMQMQGGVMRMRNELRLPLPAGKPVELGSSGYHLMLLGVKAALKAGDTVPLQLTITGADGIETNLQVSAIVRPLNVSGPTPARQSGNTHQAH